MLLGKRTKTKKVSSTAHVDFSVHVQEIKPWPASLKNLQPVVLVWKNGDRSSGVTNTVTPLVGPTPRDGKIEFNESFIIQVSFSRTAGGKLEKNLLEFNLYEPRRDKKGHLLAEAAADLADFANAGEPCNVGLPIGSKKSGKGGGQPVLYLSILPLNGDHSGRSSRDGVAMERDSSREFALLSEEYSEDADIASFTDDDGDFSPPRPSSYDTFRPTARDSRLSSYTGRLSNVGRLSNAGVHLQPDPSARESRGASRETNFTGRLSNAAGDLQDFAMASTLERMDRSRVPGEQQPAVEKKEAPSPPPASAATPEQQPAAPPEQQQQQPSSSLLRNGRKMSFAYGTNGSATAKQQFGERTYSTLSSERTKNLRLSIKITSSQSTPAFTAASAKPQEPIDPEKEDVKEVVLAAAAPEPAADEAAADGVGSSPILLPTNMINTVSSSKLRELEQKVELLEGELREAAAAEISLYSVIAEHGRSAHKLHTPARRLSRLHIHGIKNWPRDRTGRAARSAASGMLLVAKSCGSDVPRLTFWLSNTVVLRTIVSQTSKQAAATAQEKSSDGDDPRAANKKSPGSMWESLNRKKGKLITAAGQFDQWDSPEAFIAALKKIESWLFSRIVESVWWQCFTPNMQAARKSVESKSGSNKKMYGRITIVGDQKQANLSIDIWKRAFKEAAERLCPVRAGGHECGCLPMLGRLVMEQCIGRLDVAMFNAIMRESADEIPTDPMSDPITDPKVLPIPFGKSSFGAGVQLKNAIGSWLRGLTDLFGMDADDGGGAGGKSDDREEKFKPFRLLNALSDLLMLPKYMLLEKSVRREVCPTFGSSVIKKVLDRFVVDEFCPDPVPSAVLDALDSEDNLEKSDEAVRAVPCKAAPIAYASPSAAQVESVVGDVRNTELRKSGSSVVRKSHTSDDELDELDAPLLSLSNVPLTPLAKIKRISNHHNARYRLLHDAWKVDD